MEEEAPLQKETKQNGLLSLSEMGSLPNFSLLHGNLLVLNKY